MEARPRRVEEYLKADGRSPFGDWLEGLRDRIARAMIRKRLNRVRLGNLGDVKSVGEGVFELRVNYGPGYRVYFGFDGPGVVLLLYGGDKRSQDSDIRKAREYWADYWR